MVAIPVELRDKIASAAEITNCNGCERDFALEAGADCAAWGTVQKVSNLILNINASPAGSPSSRSGSGVVASRKAISVSTARRTFSPSAAITTSMAKTLASRKVSSDGRSWFDELPQKLSARIGHDVHRRALGHDLAFKLPFWRYDTRMRCNPGHVRG
jgi:hypothetical protein